MIKRYLQFIKENKENFDTIGQYVEDLAGDDEYALKIISEYTQDINPTIRIANAVNLLDLKTQNIILNKIEKYKFEKEEEKEPKITAYINANPLFEAEIPLGGKNLFRDFLKIITALGQKNISPDFDNLSGRFLVIFKSNNLNFVDVDSVMSRYHFFDSLIKNLNLGIYECRLYFGITLESKLEYGIFTSQKVIPLGITELSKGVLSYLMTLDSPSAFELKKYLVGLNFDRLNLLCKIQSEMKNFFPGSCEKRTNMMSNGNVFTIGFYGLGMWDNGILDQGELENIKTNFKNFLIPFKWSEKIQISVTADKNWVYLNFKFK